MWCYLLFRSPIAHVFEELMGFGVIDDQGPAVQKAINLKRMIFCDVVALASSFTYLSDSFNLLVSACFPLNLRWPRESEVLLDGAVSCTGYL